MPGWTDRYTTEGLAARAEIEDLIRLYCHAVDRRDWALMAQVFHDDGQAYLSTMGGDWRTFIATAVETFDAHLGATSHQVGNILIGFDGDVAFTETYCTAYHRVRADAPAKGAFAGTGEPYDFIVGFRYVDRFEKRDGRWAIAERRGVSDWRHTQTANDPTLAAVPTEFRGRHDRTDPGARAVAGWFA